VVTQTVTTVFTDLVGSTELSSRLGPDATEALRQAHFGLLRAAIQSAGGTEVKSLGDGLMVVFTSLSRALACAVAMQQAIDRHNRRGEEPLSIRVGISTGEATEDDGDYYGDCVVEAARLCALADGGQILATEVVKLMAGRHATQEFVSVGDLELKGMPEPVPCVEVVWEPETGESAPGEQLPLPARLVGASAESLFAFFGRADELARLADAQKASAFEQRLRVALISGEPGIGKTTLVAQAARAAHAAGANVVYGHCEDGLGIPYQPWITALAQLVEHTDESVLREFVDARGTALARLLPDLARRLGIAVPDAGSDADSERFLIFEGVARLLAAVSAGTPVVLVLDDLHWVDAASLQLLRHLVASGIPMAVTVVGTFRESDLSRSHPLTGVLADLRREPSVDRLDLVGLDDIEILDLMGAAAGHEMADDGVALAHALRRETAGNPFFLVEVLRHLAETGAFAQDADGRWVLSDDLDDLGLPSSVREVVAHRVARLGEPTEKALALAAVIGRDFDLDVLTALVDTDEDTLLDLLDGAIAAGIVGEPEQQFGRYRFVHALIQHTLYQDLSSARRQRAHQRIAETLEARADDDRLVAELAHHWMAATRPADAAKAIHYARRAGDAALAAYAPLDAVDWYSQALELHARQTTSDDHTRCELLTSLGTAQAQAGLPEHRDTLREAGRIALRCADRDLLVGAALARSPGFETVSEVDPDRLAVLDAALAAVGSADSTERARLLAYLAEEIDPRDVARRCDVATEAVDVAHRVGDDATLLAVLSVALGPLLSPSTLDRRRHESELALHLADRVGDVAARFIAWNARVMEAGEVGDIDVLDAALVEMETIADRTGLPFQRFVVLMYRGWQHLLAGRTDAAVADANALLDVGTKIGLSHVSATYGAMLLQQEFYGGRLAGLVDIAAQGLAENPTIPAWRTAVMTAYCELERWDEAADLFDIGLATGFSDLPFDIAWPQAAVQYADCAADLRRTDAAPLLYEQLLPYADRFAFLSCTDSGSLSRPLGRLATLLGRYDDAEGHLRDALAMHERMGARFWTGRTRIDQAELCLTRRAPGDVEAAREHLEAAQRIVDEYGLGGLQLRIDRLAAGI
jgi:class 3 adenylate cyclase/tetratricopeptide (TPR) repeat protein